MEQLKRTLLHAIASVSDVSEAYLLYTYKYAGRQSLIKAINSLISEQFITATPGIEGNRTLNIVLANCHCTTDK